MLGAEQRPVTLPEKSKPFIDLVRDLMPSSMPAPLRFAGRAFGRGLSGLSFGEDSGVTIKKVATNTDIDIASVVPPGQETVEIEEVIGYQRRVGGKTEVYEDVTLDKSGTFKGTRVK